MVIFPYLKLLLNISELQGSINKFLNGVTLKSYMEQRHQKYKINWSSYPKRYNNAKQKEKTKKKKQQTSILKPLWIYTPHIHTCIHIYMCIHTQRLYFVLLTCLWLWVNNFLSHHITSGKIILFFKDVLQSPKIYRILLITRILFPY